MASGNIQKIGGISAPIKIISGNSQSYTLPNDGYVFGWMYPKYNEAEAQLTCGGKIYRATWNENTYTSMCEYCSKGTYIYSRSGYGSYGIWFLPTD